MKFTVDRMRLRSHTHWIQCTEQHIVVAEKKKYHRNLLDSVGCVSYVSLDLSRMQARWRARAQRHMFGIQIIIITVITAHRMQKLWRNRWRCFSILPVCVSVLPLSPSSISLADTAWLVMACVPMCLLTKDPCTTPASTHHSFGN